MPSTVADRSAAVQALIPDWDLATALMGGTRAMRDAGNKYLPQWPNEDGTAYNLRIRVATLFPAYKRTVETLVGKPFSKPIKIESDVPAQIAEYLKDADLRGRNLHVFAADILEKTISHGLCGILVDFPKADSVQTNEAGDRTIAAEEAAGLRPYFIEVKAEQILGWRSEIDEGVEKLTQLRIMEVAEEQDGDWGSIEVQQVRVLTPGAWQIWRKQEGAVQSWVLYDEGVTTLDYVPFFPVYGNRIGFMQGEPPLIEMAYMNVEHWQSSSDQQTILHVARVPILTVDGVDDEKFAMTVGASSVVKLPIGASLKFVEHSGKAIAAGKTAIDDLEERMRQAGAELLQTKPQRVTAFQVGVENDLALCALQRIVQDFQDSLSQALQCMADWVKLPKGGHVSLFTDFAASNLAEASAQFLMQAAVGGKISDELLFDELQRRGMIGPNETWEIEQERLAAQGPALGAMGQKVSGGLESGDPNADSNTDGGSSSGGDLNAPASSGRPQQQGEPPSTSLSAEFAPLIAAMNALVTQLGANEAAEPTDMQIDFAPMVDALKAMRAPPQDNSMADAVKAMADAVRSMPAPVVNVAQPAITVESPQINIAPPAITVEAAQITVEAAAAPAITMPPVNVTIERNGAIRFTEDATGKVTGAVAE